MIIKLYKTQKQYKSNIRTAKTKARFVRGDDVIVISGSHKGCISKIKKRYNNDYYLLEKTKEINKNLEQKIKSSKHINEINIKIHDSNLAHYDTNAKSKSKVKYYYIKTSDNKKFRIRVYKASGTEKQLYVLNKKINSDNNTSETDTNKDNTPATEIQQENNTDVNQDKNSNT